MQRADRDGAGAICAEAVSSAKGDGNMSKADYSRREFLQRSAGIAGASLIGGSLLLEPEPLIVWPRMNAPSDKVRFGIVGVGMEGTGLLSTAVQLPEIGRAHV